jgi:D-aspartate ligase
VGTNGLDVLSALYLDLTGQPVPETTGPNHRKWIAEPLDLVSAVQLWRGGELRPRDWLRSLRGVDEAAWFAKDDPRPFGAMVARSALELVRRAGRSEGALDLQVPAAPAQHVNGTAGLRSEHVEAGR